VTADAADKATQQIYAEVRRVLGGSALSLFYSVLGAYPRFLQMHWKSFGPLACSRELLGLAERLRGEAYTRAHNYLRLPELQLRNREPNWSEEARHDLIAKVDWYQHWAAILLMLFSTQMQALDGPVGREGPPTRAELPEFAGEEPATWRNTGEAVNSVLQEIPRVLEVPFLNPEYMALARWPEFLNAYWELLKTVVQSPLYRECQYGVRETAWTLARELPGPIEMSLEQVTEAGMTQEDIASIGRILELFVKNLSGLLLNMAIAGIALEGGNQQLMEAEKPSCEPGRAA
jgi:hypothetical protein